VAADLSTTVGSVTLANPVMTAAGTAGTGPELAAYLDLAGLGAMVVKSLSVEPWAGNPAPRLHPTSAGMLNSVGLQNPGVAVWLDRDLPWLVERGVTVVASIWGRSVEDYRRVAAAIAAAPPGAIAAVEVNVSCPNVEDRGKMFAHAPDSAAAVLVATEECGLPRWAKLSPNVADLRPIVEAVAAAGAEAVTLVNTLLGMVVDVEARRPALGAGGGGLSGEAIRPVAVRAVHEVRAAFPELGIVGVGGIARGVHAVEHLMAGADAVQVGTATFADPRAPARILAELGSWLDAHRVPTVRTLVSAAQEVSG
jgi:dihydroorotate dehydrogenase (NAD+) catalytic subunit